MASSARRRRGTPRRDAPLSPQPQPQPPTPRSGRLIDLDGDDEPPAHHANGAGYYYQQAPLRTYHASHDASNPYAEALAPLDSEQDALASPASPGSPVSPVSPTSPGQGWYQKHPQEAWRSSRRDQDPPPVRAARPPRKSLSSRPEGAREDVLAQDRPYPDTGAPHRRYNTLDSRSSQPPSHELPRVSARQQRPSRRFPSEPVPASASHQPTFFPGSPPSETVPDEEVPDNASLTETGPRPIPPRLAPKLYQEHGLERHLSQDSAPASGHSALYDDWDGRYRTRNGSLYPPEEDRPRNVRKARTLMPNGSQHQENGAPDLYSYPQEPSPRVPANEVSETGSDEGYSLVQEGSQRSSVLPNESHPTPLENHPETPGNLRPEDPDRPTPDVENEESLQIFPPTQKAAENRTKSSRAPPPVVVDTQPSRSAPSDASGGADTEADQEYAPEVDQLSPVQRHYLIRALVALQLAHETSRLEKLGTLTVYGLPFSPLRPPVGTVRKDLQNEYTKDLAPVPGVEDPYAKDGLVPGDRADDALVRRSERITEPLILRHVFHTHLRTFPGLDTTPAKFWQQRVQLLFDEVAARNLSTSLERSELTQRRVWALTLSNFIGKFFARGVGVRGEGEVRGPGLGPKGSERWGVGKKWGKGTVKRGLDVPISIPPEMEEQLDDLFAPGSKSNRSGSAELEADVDRMWRLAGQRARHHRADAQAFKETLVEQEDGLEDLWDRVLRAKRVSELPARVQRAWFQFRHTLAVALYDLFVTSPYADELTRSLKSVHSLFPYWGAKQLLRFNRHPSHVLVQSLLSLLLGRPPQQSDSKSPPTRGTPLDPNERTASSRLQADEREEGSTRSQSLLQRMFSFHLTRQLDHIRETLLRPLRVSLSQAGQGAFVSRVLDYVTYADRVERAAIERRTLETGDDVLTTLLLESPAAGYGPEQPDGSETPPLKPVHEEDILAMQRAFALSMYRGHLDAAYPQDSSRYDENAVADAQEDFLQARPSPESDNVGQNERSREPAGSKRFRDEEVEKDEVKEDEWWTLTEEEEDMAYDFAQLKLLLREARRLHDREELLDVAMGPLLPTIVKDLLEYAFYDGFKVCVSSGRVDLSKLVGDIQDFVDDLIRVRHQCFASHSQLQDQGLDPDTPGSVEFVALLARHQDKLLSFFHDVYPLMEPILEWVQLGTDYLALSTSDPSHPADRTRPNIELDMDELWAEERLSAQDRRRILQEVDGLATWTLWQKIRGQLEARRDILFALDPFAEEADRDVGSRDGDAETANRWAQSRSPSLLNRPESRKSQQHQEVLGQAHLPPEPDFIEAASDVDRLLYRLMRLTGYEPDEGLCPAEARGTEAQLYPDLWCSELDPLSQHLMAEERVRELRYTPLRTDSQPPSLLFTRKLLPAFRAQIASALPNWTAPPVRKRSGPEPDSEWEGGRPGARPGPGPQNPSGLLPGPEPRPRSMNRGALPFPPSRKFPEDPYLAPPTGPHSYARGTHPAKPMSDQGEPRARAWRGDHMTPDRHSLTLPRPYPGAGPRPRPGPGSAPSPLPNPYASRGPSPRSYYSELRPPPPMGGMRPLRSSSSMGFPGPMTEEDQIGSRSPAVGSAKGKLGGLTASLARGLSLSGRALPGRTTSHKPSERGPPPEPGHAETGWGGQRGPNRSLETPQNRSRIRSRPYEEYEPYMDGPPRRGEKWDDRMSRDPRLTYGGPGPRAWEGPGPLRDTYPAPPGRGGGRPPPGWYAPS